MARYRKTKQDVVKTVETQLDEDTAAVEAKPKIVAKDSRLAGRMAKLIPFNGDTHKLDAPVMNKRGRVQNAGRPEFYLQPQQSGFDLMKIYRNGKGVARRLVMNYKTILDTPKCIKNRSIVKQLQSHGIPVIRKDGLVE